MNDVLLLSNRSFATGIGNYGFQLVSHLRKIEQLSFDFLNLSTTAEDSYGSVVNASFQKAKRVIDHLVFLCKIPREYRVYHLLNPNLGILTMKCRPAVVTVHDIYPLTPMAAYDIVSESYGLDSLILFAMKVNMRFVKHADRIISVSEHTKKDLVSILRLDPSRISIIHPGINRSLFHARDRADARERLRLPPQKKIVLHVGVDEPRKNIRTLLQAFWMVKKRIPEAMLVRIGGMRSTTQRLISSLHLEGSVIHFGKVPDIALFYNAADVLAFPSYYEGFGLPVLEAMASGLPVVAGHSSSIPEILGKTGMCFPPFDVKMLSDLVCQVISDKQLQQRIAAEELARSQRFDWNICARKTLGIYRSLYC